MFVSHRMRARVASLLLVLVSAASLIVATGLPASAMACATDGHVYINGGHVKRETDPIDGPMDTVTVLFFDIIDFGGNGLKKNEDPFWDIYREFDGAYVSTVIGNRTGNNCVSNQRGFFVDLNPGAYIVRATYEPGNSGVVIRNQAHIRLVVR